MNPSGDIAVQEAFLISISTLLMLVVIVPVIIMTVYFAWKYRASNREAEYDPDWHHSATLETVIWTAPLFIILVLSGLTFVATHRLDPYSPISRISADKPLPENVDTLVIEVVALDWKWLFFYPEQGIATVNEIAAPVDRPIQFKITSGTVMNSFYIPALAGQIYAMAGMETKMHAVINEKGVFDGFSANYSGHGFSGMRFKFHGVDEQGFDDWLEKVRSSKQGQLDTKAYLELEKKTTNHAVAYYSEVEDRLYHNILNLCVAGKAVCMDELMHHDAHRAKHTTMHQGK
jgi:cytochrome o ubiquinol oxidase subunit 2